MILSFGAFIHGHRKLGAWIRRHEPNRRLTDWLRIWGTGKGWDHVYSSVCFREAASVISCLGTLCKTKQHALGLSWSSQAETQNCPIDDSKQLLRYPRIRYQRCGRVSASLPAAEREARRIFSSSVVQDEIPSRTKKWRHWSPKWSAYFTVIRTIHRPACKLANAHINTPKFAPHSRLQVESPLG